LALLLTENAMNGHVNGPLSQIQNCSLRFLMPQILRVPLLLLALSLSLSLSLTYLEMTEQRNLLPWRIQIKQATLAYCSAFSKFRRMLSLPLYMSVKRISTSLVIRHSKPFD